MARISLKEAYDNRDVIAWLVKHEDEIDELMNILKDIDPNGDLTNIVTKTGDQTIDGIKTFIGKIVADCDIIQNGGNYETHAEQVFTTNDYIVMRDGAVSGLGTGQFSGFQVKKYNGSDDGRLVMDSSGVARVGDIGDEQPLATRDEASNMASGALVKWDGVNQKMIAPASNIGSDTRPIKIVNGEPVAVSNDLWNKKSIQSYSGGKYVEIAENLILAWGYSSITFTQTATKTISLPMTANSTDYEVFFSNTGGDHWPYNIYGVTNKTTSEFTTTLYNINSNTLSGTGTFGWMAIFQKS